MERRTFVQFAVKPHITAHRLCPFFNDVKTQTDPPDTNGFLPLYTVKGLKEQILIVRADSDSFISNAHHDAVPLRLISGRKGDASPFGTVFDRIAQQILYDLAEFVTVHRYIGEAGGYVSYEFMPVGTFQPDILSYGR